MSLLRRQFLWLPAGADHSLPASGWLVEAT
jgi:hypothetical protein